MSSYGKMEPGDLIRKPILYPVSEIFTSPQGEGYYVGTLMTFIRLAGCSVGKPFPKERYRTPESISEGGNLSSMAYSAMAKEVREANLLPIYTEQCTTYDGRKFECDTDYRVKWRLEIPEIMELIPSYSKYVCITGGEPFIHNLTPLVHAILSIRRLRVHIETSGTKPMSSAFSNSDSMSVYCGKTAWITVSPKFDYLPEMIARANEIKLLVDENFDEKNQLVQSLGGKMVFLQPINNEHTLNMDNVNRCIELQKKFPTWRLSNQQHKTIGVR